MKSFAQVRFFLLGLLIAFGVSTAFSQTSISSHDKVLSGASTPMSVAWNPSYSYYYASAGGSSSSQVRVFNSSGTQLQSGSHNMDNRGLWYNPNNGRLEGNKYSGGYYYYPLSSGKPSGNALQTYSGGQPSSQYGAALNTSNNERLFYGGGTSFYRYSSTGSSLGTVSINKPGGANFNGTHMIYTGVSGQEVGFYDYTNKRVYLYSINGGSYIHYYQLPSGAPSASNYGFAYCNNRFWVSTDGTWYGYPRVGTAPGTPSSASASSTGTSTANLSWSSSSGATTYYWVVGTSSSVSYGSGVTQGSTSGTSASASGLSANTTYYLRVYASNASGNSGYRTSSFFTTHPANPSGITASMNNICPGSNVTLTASGVQGAAYWYSGSCGGVYISSGSSITVNPQSTTNYYVRNYNGNFSSGCASQTINVSLPATPTSVTAAPTSVCTGDPVNLNATSAGNEIHWYTTASGGTAFSAVSSGANVAVNPASATTYYAESVKPTGGAGSLSSILNDFNSNYSNITSLVPNRYNFSMDGSGGVNSNTIGDGGNDMYDNGNYLNTNNASQIQYSDNSIVSSSAFGSGGEYFTRYINGMFIMVADMNNVSSFYTSGNNGADGGGSIEALEFSVTVDGNNYDCFVKKIFNAGDPSINQLVIIPENASASHTWSSNTNDGNHTISNLSSTTRLYYLLYASASGGYINQTVTQNIATTFLDEVNAGGGGVCASASRTPVTVNINDNEWTGLVSGDWGNSGNWACGTVPDAVTSAVIPNGATAYPSFNTSGNMEADALIIDYGGTLTVPAGVGLEINGDLTLNGQIVLQSDASGTATMLDNGTITGIGSLLQQRYLDEGGYHYVGAAHSNATVSELGDDMNLVTGNPYIGNDTNNTVFPFPTIFAYDETNPAPTISLGWSDPGTNLVQGRGYAAHFGSYANTLTADVAGSPSTGTVVVPVTNTPSGSPSKDGWNLLANPYPSALDWNSVVRSNVNNAYYVLDPTAEYTGTYYSYVNGISNPGGALSNLIPPMQAFFVKATANGSLTMNNSARQLADPNFYKASPNNPIIRLKAYADGSNKSDETCIYIDFNATTSFDQSMDALHLINTDKSIPNIYTRLGNDNYSINAIPEITENTVIPLRYTVDHAGNYEINAYEISNMQAGTHVYLYDALLNVSQELSQNPVYTFSMNPNDNPDRFFIRFAPISATGINESANSTLMYTENNSIHLSRMEKGKAVLKVFSASGQLLIEKSIEGAGSLIINTDLPFGIYTLSLYCETSVTTKKVLIK